LNRPEGASLCFSNPLTTVVKHYPELLSPDSNPPRQLLSQSQERLFRSMVPLAPGGYLHFAPTISQAKMGEAFAAVYVTSFFTRAGMPIRPTQSRFVSWEDLTRETSFFWGTTKRTRGSIGFSGIIQCTSHPRRATSRGRSSIPDRARATPGNTRFVMVTRPSRRPRSTLSSRCFQARRPASFAADQRPEHAGNAKRRRVPHGLRPPQGTRHRALQTRHRPQGVLEYSGRSSHRGSRSCANQGCARELKLIKP